MANVEQLKQELNKWQQIANTTFRRREREDALNRVQELQVEIYEKTTGDMISNKPVQDKTGTYILPGGATYTGSLTNLINQQLATKYAQKAQGAYTPSEKTILTFESPSGKQEFEYDKNKLYAYNVKTGEVSAYPRVMPSGEKTILADNMVMINPFTAERVYGEGQVTSDVAIANLQQKFKTATPLEKASVLVSPLIFKTKDVVGTQLTYAGRLISGDPLATEKYKTDVKDIYKGMLDIYYPTGQMIKLEPGVISPTALKVGARSELVGYEATYLGGQLTGGAIKQIGLLGTIPAFQPVAQSAVNISRAIGASPLATAITSNILTLAPVATSALSASYFESKEKEFKASSLTTAQKVGSYTGDVASFYLFSKGFQSGLEYGLPLEVRGVAIEGKTINVGLNLQGKTQATQLFGKTLQYDIGGVQASTWNIGNPKSVLLPLVTKEYVPTSPISTKLLMIGAKDFSTGAIPISAYSVNLYTYGTKAKILKTDVLGQSDIYSRLPKSAQTFSKDFLKSSQTSFLNDKYIYGGTSTSAQIGTSKVIKLSGYTGKGQLLTTSEMSKLPFSSRLLYRTTYDVDVHFATEFGATMQQKAVTGLRSAGVKARGVGTAQVEVNLGKGWEKYLDIHGIDNPPEFQAVSNAFGFKELGKVRAGQFKITQLSQEATNKLASVGAYQPGGRFGVGEVARRGKDYADFYRIQQELIFQKTGIGSLGKAKALFQLEIYKSSVITNYGRDVWTSRELISVSSQSSKAISANIPLISPSATSQVKMSPIVVTSKSSVSSVKVSQVSPSPSKSPSFVSYSLSRVYSRVSASPSKIISYASPSPSKSPSISLYPSPSISPSISISSSPSPSISYGPSPSPTPFNPPFVPIMLFGGAMDLFGSRNIKSRKKTGYIPSASALFFNIKGTYKGGKLSKSGLDFRPIDPKRFKISRRLRF